MEAFSYELVLGMGSAAGVAIAEWIRSTVGVVPSPWFAAFACSARAERSERVWFSAVVSITDICRAKRL